MTAKPTRAQLMDRLVAALTYHLNNEPECADRTYLAALALRFQVNKKTMIRAIQMMAQKHGR